VLPDEMRELRAITETPARRVFERHGYGEVYTVRRSSTVMSSRRG
jgi:hypothetical protein